MDSGVGDMEINGGATPLATMGTAPAAGGGTTEDVTIPVDDGGGTGTSTAGTAVTWEGGDAVGTGAVMGFMMDAGGTVLLAVLPPPAAPTLPPGIALGNENTPTDAMDFPELL